MPYEKEDNSIIKLEAIRYIAQQSLARVDDILKCLQKIEEHTAPKTEPKTIEIMKHESQATCPECDSTQVSMSRIDNDPIYRCRDCHQIWING